jgi:Flp pilus assembly protein TadD
VAHQLLEDLGRNLAGVAAAETLPQGMHGQFDPRLVGQADNPLRDATRRYLVPVLRHKPEHLQAHNNLGVAMQRLRRLPEAVAAYREALTQRPHFAEAHNNLGAVLQELGRLDDAISCYRAGGALSARPP